MNNRAGESIVFDRAKWHDGSIEEEGLDEDQSFVHTGLFVAWCALSGLWAETFLDADRIGIIESMQARTVAPIALYQFHDGTFLSDMLTIRGRRFARSYYHGEANGYYSDYAMALSLELPSIFQIPNSWESYDTLVPILNSRLMQFETSTN